VSDRSPFAYFATALVVNLDADAERMERAAGRLKRLGVEFERFAALPAPADLVSRDPRVRPGHYACAMTHRAALRRAMASGAERVLIFEDDVLLRDDASRWLRRIVPQLREVEWDVFYLGLHLEQAGRRLGDNLLEVRRGYHTHAYAIARKAMPRLITYIDAVLERLAGTFDGYEDATLLKVCASPILAVQEPSFSHTFGRPMDRLALYFRRFDGDDFRRHCREMMTPPAPGHCGGAVPRT
jgi:GR25 family glycosyltransferase involved in LPS biosynthesis